MIAKAGLVALLLAAGTQEASACDVQISVATSLRKGMAAVADAFTQVNARCQVSLNVAGSHALARQVAAGARVDVFLAADSTVLEIIDRQPIRQKKLLYNDLVAIGSVKATSIERLLAEAKWIAIGQPALPAGRYAHTYLQQAKLFDALKSKLVYADNVRGVVTLLERRAVQAAFVYATELPLMKVRPASLLRVPGVEVAYPAALYSPTHTAAKFFDFLSSGVAAKIFRKFGFRVSQPDE